MVGMAAIGTLSYNGYTFDGAAKIKARVEFQYDSAGRAVLYHRHVIRAEAVVASAAGTTDDEMASIRALLSKPGKAFQFINRGFGSDLIVNVTPALSDVAFGPKPKVLEWEPIAGACAANIIWEVEVCVPVCDASGIHRSTGIMSFNYDIDFDIDRGWTTRTITGTIGIAQTRLPGGPGGAGRIGDHADYYREKIRAGDIAPPGFERRSKWTTSEDKSTLSFAITDTQIRSQNPYPPGVVDISATHGVFWRRANRGGARQQNRLNMQIELLPTSAKTIGFLVFASLLTQRLAIARSGGKGALLEDVSVEEDIWGMSSSFSATWTTLKGLDELIQGSGIFTTPTINSRNWAAWNESVKRSQSQRGYLNARDFAANDILVDMCTFETPPISSGQPELTYRRDRRPLKPKNELPPRASSYKGFGNAIILEKDMPAVRQSPSQYPYTSGGGLSTESGGSSGSGTTSPGSQSTNPIDVGFQFTPNERKQYDDTIQLSGGGKTTVSMIGWAERVGYEVPRPSLQKYGGLTVEAGQIVETNVKFSQQCSEVVYGVPVYQATWMITYMLTNTPSNGPTPNYIIPDEGQPPGWIA